MALLTPMSLAHARAIGGEYGLDVAAVDALSAGSVNSNFRFRTASEDSYFVRVYEEQGADGAARELELLDELHRLSVPTPAPLRREAGGHAAQHEGKPVGVVPWVQGESFCFGRVTPAVAHAVGSALARVHTSSGALRHIPIGRFGIANLRARLDFIDRTNPAFAADTAFIRKRLDRYSGAVGEVPTGLIHGDLFRDNVLFRNGELVALIDFESASFGAFIYDLMVCIHAWCYGTGFELELVRSLVNGYTAVRRLEPEERRTAKAHGALAALRFATTRITDFSFRAPPGKEPVRDYKRFLARLAAIEAGVLDPIIERGAT